MSRDARKSRQRRQRRQAARDARRILAAASAEKLVADCGDSEVEILAAGEGGEVDSGRRRVRIVAYTGGKMRPMGFDQPVVADLRKMRVYAGKLPLHLYHDQKRPIGHGDATIDKSVRVEGEISVDGADSTMFTASADSAFPWKASVGVTLDEPLKFYGKDESFQANGRTFRGPCYYAGRTTLFEVSFVTVAGDPQTRVAVASHQRGDAPMGFEAWLQANGWDAETLTDDQKKVLRAAYEAETAAVDDSDADDAPAGNLAATGASAEEIAALRRELLGSFQRDLEKIRRESADELNRQSAIERLRAEFGPVTVTEGDQQVDLYAHAIATGMTAQACELRALRASRAKGPAIHVSAGGPPSEAILTAAAVATLGVHRDDADLVAEFGEETMNRAEPLVGIGLRELAAMACRMEGKDIPAIWGDGRQTLKAAFTTQALPHLLENIANKTLLPIWERVEVSAMQLCKVGRTSDFKIATQARLYGSGAWERVGPTGELQHGQLSDEKFTRQVDSFGQFLMLSWQEFKNDDLGALTAIAEYMAMMGLEVIDHVFWTAFLNPSNGFYSTGEGTLASATKFGLNGLTTTKTLFRKRKVGPGTRAKNARHINIRPVHLVVPVELEDEATSFLGSPNLIADGIPTGAASKTGPKNPHYGQYRVHSAPQVSDATYTGASATQYFMLADPNVLPAFNLTFLDGVQRPTIEAVDPKPSQLGMGFRGHIHFGVDEGDNRGIVKNAGA